MQKNRIIFNAPFFKILLLSIVQMFTHSVNAFDGDITFDDYEVSQHRHSASTITSEAGRCLDETIKYHHDFMKKWGVSPYYGDVSDFGRMNDDARRAFLQSIGKPPELLEQMNPISCVGMALKCLNQGFAKVNESATWDKIYQFVQLNGVDGTSLQYALQKLGWTLYYWNPNTAYNAQWDAAEKEADPTNVRRIWGYHEFRYATATGPNHTYADNYVNDWSTFVNYGRRAPLVLRRAKFFVGTAHGGYHVFPGTKGEVVEGHSMRDIRDVNTIESSPFAPLQKGGGPNGPYKSGLLALPPN